MEGTKIKRTSPSLMSRSISSFVRGSVFLVSLVGLGLAAFLSLNRDFLHSTWPIRDMNIRQIRNKVIKDTNRELIDIFFVSE